MSSSLERLQVGGPIRPGSLYVERPADRELPATLLERKLCYVLAPRQIGKSSLLLRTRQQLAQRGMRCVLMDLNIMGSEPDDESWYYGLLDEIVTQLQLATDLHGFWQRSAHLSPVHRWARFLRAELPTLVGGPVVLCFDEIDHVLSLRRLRPDDFFASLRSDRSNDARAPLLTFCLTGVAAPKDLIADPTRTPFNTGTENRLEAFTLEEARAFLPALRPCGHGGAARRGGGHRDLPAQRPHRPCPVLRPGALRARPRPGPDRTAPLPLQAPAAGRRGAARPERPAAARAAAVRHGHGAAGPGGPALAAGAQPHLRRSLRPGLGGGAGAGAQPQPRIYARPPAVARVGQGPGAAPARTGLRGGARLGAGPQRRDPRGAGVPLRGAEGRGAGAGGAAAAGARAGAGRGAAHPQPADPAGAARCGDGPLPPRVLGLPAAAQARPPSGNRGGAGHPAAAPDRGDGRPGGARAAGGGGDAPPSWRSTRSALRWPATSGPQSPSPAAPCASASGPAPTPWPRPAPGICWGGCPSGRATCRARWPAIAALWRSKRSGPAPATWTWPWSRRRSGACPGAGRGRQ